MEEKSFNKLNKNLHHEVASLWDECFGDLPIASQRLLKAYGTISSKKAYTHWPKTPITIAKLQRTKLHIFEGDNYFEKGTLQQEQAQSLTEKIINKLKKGNNHTSRVLREFLKDKKILVGVHKQLADDASFDGYNPLTKELYIDLCAGIFHYSKERPELFNDDSLAHTIGHELGHAVEESLSRSYKTASNVTGVSSNGWEIESFCDAFGTALCVGAGYDLTSKINKLKMFEEKELANHHENNPHPPLIQRRKLIELMLKAYKYEDKSNIYTPYPESIIQTEWDKNKIEETGKKATKLSTKEQHI